MKQSACLDAGVLSIFFSSDCTQDVEALMKSIKEKEVHAFILRPILIESYYHICRIKGNEIARITITSFIKEYPVNLTDITEDLIFSAGKLKCQNGNTLSYNDCLSIAFCLNNKVEFHTTEKNLKKNTYHILKRLKIKTYSF